ncbi:cell adhesion complex protein bystin-like protein, partial [Leptotrombidium deliense]
MGKAKKIKISGTQRNVPLERQLDDDSRVKPIRGKNRNNETEDAEVGKLCFQFDIESYRFQFIDSKLSKVILREARKQAADLEEEHEQKPPKSSTSVTLGNEKFDSDEDVEEKDESDVEYEDVHIDEEEEKALELFMSKERTQRKTLADYIMEKLKEKQTEINTQFSDAASLKTQDLDPKVVELYRGVKLVLSRYRSGKIPKAFKIIPALSNWEQILSITDPDSWSAAAMCAATRLFTSNLKEKMAQRFFNLILLPRVRDDIAEYKRLNFHLYQALRKAMFK